MANIKILKDRQILKDLAIKVGQIYEVLDIVVDSYKIAVPMKHRGKFRNILVSEDEGELIDQSDFQLYLGMKHKKLTEQEIIEIAKKNGTFDVSPKWRDDYIRSICKSLKKRGIFKQIRFGVFESFSLTRTLFRHRI